MDSSNQNTSWKASEKRYETMPYKRCGRSGLKLPRISMGMWHNFGHNDSFENARNIIHASFDLGITHFDLANNYGPPPGSAEENFGKILKSDLAGHRDELVISSKAGHLMWPGPYGEFGSRKYLMASIDQSLKRLGIDYVDIFYHHCPDPETPIEETMSALDYIVRSGRALYVGISKYSPEKTREAAAILRDLGTPCLIHQPYYNMLKRDFEHNGLFDSLLDEGIGCIVFSPLAQGMLTSRYLNGIPEGSRATKSQFLTEKNITQELLAKVRKLNAIAAERGQSLAQTAIAWALRHPAITSALVGASRPEQIAELVRSVDNVEFCEEELARIEKILAE